MRGVPGRVLEVARVSLVALLVAGCGEADEEISVREGEQEEAFCTAQCRRDAYCSGSDRLGPCKTYCRARVSGLEDYRPEGIEIVTRCIGELTCPQFYQPDSFIPCWERAEREIEPNDDVRRFCLVWTTRWFECGARFSTQECESGWALMSGAYLARMASCLDLPCDELSACTDAVQGGS